MKPWIKFYAILSMFCSDDEDDTAELLAELQRIKKERAQEEAKQVNGLVKAVLLFYAIFRSTYSGLHIILHVYIHAVFTV